MPLVIRLNIALPRLYQRKVDITDFQPLGKRNKQHPQPQPPTKRNDAFGNGDLVVDLPQPRVLHRPSELDIRSRGADDAYGFVGVQVPAELAPVEGGREDILDGCLGDGLDGLGGWAGEEGLEGVCVRAGGEDGWLVGGADEGGPCVGEEGELVACEAEVFEG